jgi:sugar phosphate isomerase/epimerase
VAAQLDPARVSDDARLAEHRPLGGWRALGAGRDRPAGLVARRQRDRLPARHGIFVATGPGIETELASIANPGPPAWSQDGKSIAYGVTSVVFTVPADGSAPPKSVANALAGVAGVSWRADGAGLAVAYLRGVSLVSFAGPGAGGQGKPVAGSSGPGVAYLNRTNTLLLSASGRGCGGRVGIAELTGGRNCASSRAAKLASSNASVQCGCGRDHPQEARRSGATRRFPDLRAGLPRQAARVPRLGCELAEAAGQVLEAMTHFYETSYANVHRGVYELAERATEALEHAREAVPRVRQRPDESSEIIFVRNATEAINLVAYSWGLANLGPGDVVVVTELEHHANFVPWQYIAHKQGAEFRMLPVDDDGTLHLDELDELAGDANVKVVATSYVSNVLGGSNDIPRIAAWAHERGAIHVTDAAQAAPHKRIDVQALGTDFVAVSGHKMLRAERRSASSGARPSCCWRWIRS